MTFAHECSHFPDGALEHFIANGALIALLLLAFGLCFLLGVMIYKTITGEL